MSSKPAAAQNAYSSITGTSVETIKMPWLYETFLGGQFSLNTSGSTHSNMTLDGLGSTANLQTGMVVTGSGIPSGTTISAIAGASSITLSASATATATVPINFSLPFYIDANNNAESTELVYMFTTQSQDDRGLYTAGIPYEYRNNVALELRRVGSNALDTLTQPLWLLSAQLLYVSRGPDYNGNDWGPWQPGPWSVFGPA